MKTFTRDGVRFRYPADWAVAVDDSAAGWTVTVDSSGTAFAVVSLRRDADGAGAVADEVLATYRAEYPGLDAEPVTATLAGGPAVGHDLDLLTLDSTAAVWSRAADTTAGPLLVLLQVSDLDRHRYEPALRAVLASVEIAEG
jgi:hypothetical protein